MFSLVEIVIGLEEELGFGVEEESALSITTVQEAADMNVKLFETNIHRDAQAQGRMVGDLSYMLPKFIQVKFKYMVYIQALKVKYEQCLDSDRTKDPVNLVDLSNGVAASYS
ncbi:hypothetical protein RIF29_19034 [Crotalaria pallida]|uniref:Uncharacterized protein n=1 Tax=Crotalaria pallida TaxID=3830 RepID=A0AAN9F118_CROPI